jgi:hypothetical protein
MVMVTDNSLLLSMAKRRVTTIWLLSWIAAGRGCRLLHAIPNSRLLASRHGIFFAFVSMTFVEY